MTTHRYLGDGEALMLLGELHPDYKGAGAGLALLMFHEYNELLRQGITRLITHVSARNYAVLNSAMRAKFRVTQTHVILRKFARGVNDVDLFWTSPGSDPLSHRVTGGWTLLRSRQ